VEIVPDAIKDAKANAIKNNITNCEFFVGKAEDILLPIIQRTTKSNIIAIVDPPRAGLRKLHINSIHNVDIKKFQLLPVY